MASAGTAGVPANPPEPSMGARDALRVVGSTMALLVGLYLLRFVFNIFLDVCVLDESDRARRSIAEVFRKLCPCWHVRTQPADLSSAGNSSGGAALADIENAIARGAMSDRQKQELLSQILPSKPITPDDLKEWKREMQGSHHNTNNNHQHRASSQPLDQQQIIVSETGSVASGCDGGDATSNSGGGCRLCSICLHEFGVGDSAFTARNCQHMFHQHCIVQWVSVSPTRNNYCPYCRTTELCSIPDLQRVLLLQPRSNHGSNVTRPSSYASSIPSRSFRIQQFHVERQTLALSSSTTNNSPPSIELRGIASTTTRPNDSTLSPSQFTAQPQSALATQQQQQSDAVVGDSNNPQPTIPPGQPT